MCSTSPRHPSLPAVTNLHPPSPSCPAPALGAPLPHIPHRSTLRNAVNHHSPPHFTTGPNPQPLCAATLPDKPHCPSPFCNASTSPHKPISPPSLPEHFCNAATSLHNPAPSLRQHFCNAATSPHKPISPPSLPQHFCNAATSPHKPAPSLPQHFCNAMLPPHPPTPLPSRPCP